ncbi:MAG TPA: LCP family protein [Thermoanaerobaculia bacterium]|jgi:LCP family protein required for cell wall assembly
MSADFRPTRYSKWNPDGSGRHAVRPDLDKEKPKPTRTQSAVEIALFIVFGVLLVLAAVALYTSNSAKYKEVPNTVAAGLKNDRVNILLFGIGGDNHPKHDQLADSIMLVSLKPSTKEAALVSVPRDLWVRIGPYGSHRINYAHEAGGQSGYPGAGPGLLCDTVSRVFGQPVHAYVRVDFAAFEKLIDDVGGVDVYCQRGFYDFLFHDGFSQGWHHLGGKRALAYARYRYVIGPEGDNFARELRQQQVVNALRDKLQRLSPQDALKMLSAATTLSNATQTNLTATQMVTLYRRFHDIKPQSIRHVSLKPMTEVFEVTRLAEPGQAVRVPNDDYAPLQSLEADIFSSHQQVSTDDAIHITGQ